MCPLSQLVNNCPTWSIVPTQCQNRRKNRKVSPPRQLPRREAGVRTRLSRKPGVVRSAGISVPEPKGNRRMFAETQRCSTGDPFFLPRLSCSFLEQAATQRTECQNPKTVKRRTFAET